jgi:hypothetical protein
MTPVAFYFLRLVASCAKMIDDFEHRIGDPFGWDVPAIIEPQG